jgi:hypothetical protein
VTKYRLLTGDGRFDALIEQDSNPYIQFRLFGDREKLTEALYATVRALRVDLARYTSEVRYTDRVLRFPQLFTQPAMFPIPVEGRTVPDPALLYSSLTGEPGSGLYFPTGAVRWRTTPRDLAALVSQADNKSFVADLFHFGSEKRSMEAELLMLEEGSYFAKLIAIETGQILFEMYAESSDKPLSIPLLLPPGMLCRLEVGSGP